MKKRRNISHIRLMMISSQLLLALFLGYWLYTQFGENRKMLTADLARGLRQSEQQVIDSMLATQLINPIIKDSGSSRVFMYRPKALDSVGFSSEYTYGRDTVHQIVMQFTGDKDSTGHITQLPLNQSRIKIVIEDSLRSDDSTNLTITRQDTSNKLLFQSVKLLISSVEKFSANGEYFITKIDTALLKSLFSQFLYKEYKDFTVVWQPKNQLKSTVGKVSGIVLDSDLFEKKMEIIVHHYHYYLLKAIGPQILFAFILLLITALAFWMAYASLKNQRRLILLKNDFISNISHELKTPVSTVKVALEALLDFDMKADPKRTREYLEMAHSEMNRLDLLVSQVLNNSTLEEGKPFIKLENLDLPDLVKEVLLSMQSRFDKVGAEVNFNVDEKNLVVHADKLHIHGVIVNLIDNSLKYCDKKPRIVIRISRNDKETLFTLEDNGIGIPAEYLDKVFEKFFRVPTENKHNVKGYGLGLNYAALVMQHHQGKIAVVNLDGGGCRFTLSFLNMES